MIDRLLLLHADVQRVRAADELARLLLRQASVQEQLRRSSCNIGPVATQHAEGIAAQVNEAIPHLGLLERSLHILTD